MESSIKPLNFIKKYRIALVSVAAFAVALGCIISFAGNDASDVSGVSSEYVVSATVSSESAGTQSSLPESVAPEAELLCGTGIYIDNCFIGAVSDSAVAESALNTVLNERASELNIDPSAEISFNNSVDLVSGEYAADSFVTASDVARMLDNGVSNYLGESIPVKLSVRSVVTASEKVVLEYNTKTIYTDALANGKKSVLIKGYNGEGIETAEIISVDGVETGRNVVSLDVTTPAKDSVVRVGSRSSSHSVSSVAKFVKPYDGIITSYTGPRWGRIHKGIDIAGPGCHGDPVVAASSGVVVLAEWYSTYGNCVIIDHGNGIQTLYAHFSSITVSEGDVVSAGDVVGKIGDTGNTTGSHLHFEVRVDGECVNPLFFVKY
ncbi:MAG: peptidoglycan DD-metalloendopeptidase family protein [Clostridia bacterium]|nr:peptidoglycan DD-metalloendopeptidase family protein [Clostridia bacterium]